MSAVDNLQIFISDKKLSTLIMVVFLNEVFVVHTGCVRALNVQQILGRVCGIIFILSNSKLLPSFHKLIFIEFRFDFTFTPTSIFLAEAFGEPPVLRPVPPFLASFPSSFPGLLPLLEQKASGSYGGH